MTREDELAYRINIIRQALKNIPNIKLNTESLRQAKIHALLSLGDRKTADILAEAHKIGWTKTLKKHSGYYENIIYKQKAIIYSVARDIIVNVGPVFIQEGDELVNPEVNETSEGGLEVSELNPPLSNDISDSGTPTDTNPIVE